MEEISFKTVELKPFETSLLEIPFERVSFLDFERLDVTMGPIIENPPRTPKRANKGGRPTTMTKGTLQKLRSAYLIGCSDREACIFAGIAFQTLYNYQAIHPEFLEQKQGWKLNVAITANLTVAKAIETDPKMAWKYLEKKFPEEFGKSR